MCFSLCDKTILTSTFVFASGSGRRGGDGGHGSDGDAVVVVIVGGGGADEAGQLGLRGLVRVQRAAAAGRGHHVEVHARSAVH